ncbi:MAG: hypothetical protein RLZZ02_1223 [Bacteroidota bacterium]
MYPAKYFRLMVDYLPDGYPDLNSFQSAGHPALFFFADHGPLSEIRRGMLQKRAAQLGRPLHYFFGMNAYSAEGVMCSIKYVRSASGSKLRATMVWSGPIKTFCGMARMEYNLEAELLQPCKSVIWGQVKPSL